MDISSRHLPDLSDVSVAPDISDASFQIPVASGSSSKQLLADDSADFLGAADVTLTSPGKTPRTTRSRSKALHLPLFELSPRSRPLHVHSRSPKKRPAIPSPLKRAVASDLSAALGDTLSPFKTQDISFQIPAIGKSSMDLLMEDDSGDFFGKGVTASFMEEPVSPRAREPLTLSQLTPGPKIVRSPTPAKTTQGSFRDAIDENAEPFQSQKDPVLDGVDIGHTRLPSLFSNLKAEIETLVHDGETSAQGVTHSPRLASHLPSIGQSVDEDTKNMIDTVEVRSATPRVQTAEVIPPVIEGLATRKVSVHVQQEKPESSVREGGAPKQSESNPKPHSSGPTLNSMVPRRKPKSQPQPRGRANSQALRSEASKFQAKAADSESVDADTASCDVTMSEAGGLAAALVSYGQRTTVVSTQSLKAGNTELKSGGILSHTGASSSVPNSDLKRDPPPKETQASVSNVQLSTSGADSRKNRTLPDSDSLAQSQVSPTEDEDVVMVDVPSQSSNTSNQSLSLAESQTRHDVCEKTPGMSMQSAVPPSPKRTSTKRSASAVSEDQPPPQQAPPRKRAKILPTVTEPPGPSQSKARNVKVVTRAAKAGRSTRILHPRRKPMAAVSTSHSSLSASESGVRFLRSAAPPGAGNLDKLDQAASSTLQDLSTSTGDVRSSRAAHAHMTRSQTRAPSQASASSASSSTASRSGDSKPDNPFDTEAGRQVRPFEGNRPTRKAQGRGHMHGSQLNQAGVALPPAKTTKPIEFHFESDARLEARRTGFAESSTLTRSQHANPSIPNFKTLHEAQARENEARKEHVVPVQPQEFRFSTDVRMQERHKYDQARREREQEAERLLEEKRRLEALEEEKEIRELRRRAVPKANEVPEWYAFAPKRSQAK